MEDGVTAAASPMNLPAGERLREEVIITQIPLFPAHALLLL
jgi:hypothetical protein